MKQDFLKSNLLKYLVYSLGVHLVVLSLGENFQKMPKSAKSENKSLIYVQKSKPIKDLKKLRVGTRTGKKNATNKVQGKEEFKFSQIASKPTLAPQKKASFSKKLADKKEGDQKTTITKKRFSYTKYVGSSRGLTEKQQIKIVK